MIAFGSGASSASSGRAPAGRRGRPASALFSFAGSREGRLRRLGRPPAWGGARARRAAAVAVGLGRLRVLPVVVLVVVGGLVGCAPGGAAGEVPRCDSVRRLALVAQAVPDAAYVPCVDHLEEGWADQGFAARRGRVTFRLEPTRTGGRPVRVEFAEGCGDGDGVPITPRAEGVRSSVDLRSISPRYTGTLTDVFPGGCVTYRFDFRRGPHIPLMEELRATIGLVSRRELALDLRRELSVELDR